MERFLKQRKGELLSEGELMLKFVQLCLALHHVHAKVRLAWQGWDAVSYMTNVATARLELTAPVGVQHTHASGRA